MPSEPRSLLQRWRYAAKPASWPKLVVPFLLGQAIGLEAHGEVNLAALGLGLVFTFFDLLFIVFLNDWGDRDVDALKRRMFPDGCSQKTIPDGILPAHHLLLAGIGAGLAALGVAVAGQVLLDRPWLGVLGAAGLSIFVAYTLPPLRLNYRGGGEFLEMVGVGLVLPLFSIYLQAGSLSLAGLWILPGFALLSLASALASGLADERSDRKGGKCTFVSQFGNTAGRRTIEGFTFAGGLVWLLASPIPLWVRVPAAAVVLYHGVAMLRASAAATTDAFAAQKAYKGQLHAGLWRGALVASMLLTWWHLRS